MGIGRALYPFCQGRTLHEIVDVAAAVEKDGRKVGNLPATINRKLSVLRRIGKLAYKRWGWLENDLGGKIHVLLDADEVMRLVFADSVESLLLFVG